jgi:hypothetical protein
LPRVPVGQKFKWTSYAKEQAYTVPSTLVGRKGDPNIVDFGGTEQNDSRWTMLDDLVPNLGIEVFNEMPKPATAAR